MTNDNSIEYVEHIEENEGFREYFKWLGEFEEAVTIGPYAIFSYRPHSNPETLHYAFAVDGVMIPMTERSLDLALLSAIGEKYIGINCEFAYYAARMLGI